MNEPKGNPSPKREYPPIYEKIIPIAIGAIVIAIIILLLVILGVITGMFPWAG